MKNIMSSGQIQVKHEIKGKLVATTALGQTPTLKHVQDQEEEEESKFINKMVRRYMVRHGVDANIIINK